MQIALSVFLVLVLFYLIIIPHELTHAFFGFLFKTKVQRIIIGAPFLIQTRVGDTEIVIGLPIIGGVHLPHIQKLSPWKQAVIFLSGIFGTVFVYPAIMVLFARTVIMTFHLTYVPLALPLTKCTSQFAWLVSAFTNDAGYGVANYLATFTFLYIILGVSVGMFNAIPIPPFDMGRGMFPLCRVRTPPVFVQRIGLGLGLCALTFTVVYELSFLFDVTSIKQLFGC